MTRALLCWAELGHSDILSSPFELAGLSPSELEIHMSPLPLEIDRLTVTAEGRRLRLDGRGFYRRQRSALGHFFDENDLLDLHPEKATDLLRRVPGVTVIRSRYGGTIAATWRRGRPCPMKLIVDGFPADLAAESFDDWVRPGAVLGIVVYPGGVGAPIEHRGLDARCGIVLVWPR